MDNLDIKVTGNKAVITVPDISHRGQMNSSGKTVRVASTAGGAYKVRDADGNEVSIQLNVWAKPGA